MKKCLAFCGVISYLALLQTSHKDPILNPVPRSKVDLGNPFFQSLMKYFCSCSELNDRWLWFVVIYSNFTGSPTFKLFYLEKNMMAALTCVLSSIYSRNKKWRAFTSSIPIDRNTESMLKKTVIYGFFDLGKTYLSISLLFIL